MATRDIADLLQDGSLTYPDIPSETYPEGRAYTIPGPSARMGMLFTQMAQEGMSAALNGQISDKLQLDEDDERSLWQQVMGCRPDCGAVTNGDEIAEARAALLSDDSDDVVIPEPVFAKPCGSVFDQMIADGVSWFAMQTIGKDAFLNFGANPEFADVYLSLQRTPDDAASADAEGNAPAPANRQERRAAAKKAPAKKAARKRAPAKKTSSAAKAG